MNKRAARIEVWYRRIGKVSVGAVLFLILVGGIVRSTGSGMGCPDWPKCFGLIVPPSDVSEIPVEFFASHPGYSTQEFNAFQTWTEYINRLIGALIGLFMFATAVLSLGFWRRDKRIVILSVAAMLMTGFEAWLGKIVVDRHLEGGMVTIHMLVAMLILATLITAVYLAAGHKGSNQARKPSGLPRHFAWLGFALTTLTLVQILLGTQVREEIDVIAASMGYEGRENWVASLGGYYAFHKVIWILVAGLAVVWVRNILSQVKSSAVKTLAWIVLGSLFAEVLLGLVLGNFALPPYLQPLHLLVAAILFAAEFAILINVMGAERLLNGWFKIDYRSVDKRSLVNAK